MNSKGVKIDQHFFTLKIFVYNYTCRYQDWYPLISETPYMYVILFKPNIGLASMQFILLDAMWELLLKERILCILQQILSFKRCPHFEKGSNWRESLLFVAPTFWKRDNIISYNRWHAHRILSIFTIDACANNGKIEATVANHWSDQLHMGPLIILGGIHQFLALNTLWCLLYCKVLSLCAWQQKAFWQLKILNVAIRPKYAVNVWLSLEIWSEFCFHFHKHKLEAEDGRIRVGAGIGL